MLLADDDLLLCRNIVEYFGLMDPDFDIVCANDGKVALDYFKSESFDLVLLDIFMPEKDGYEVLKEIRKLDPVIPVIFFTCADLDSENRVNCYDLGVCEYVDKAIHLNELAAKINVWSKYKEQYKTKSKQFHIADHCFDLKDRLLIVGDISVYLKEKQFEVLQILLENAGRTIKRREILLAIWKDDSSNNDQMLCNTINEIRQILSPLENVKIKTRYGFGYELKSI